MSFEVAPKLGFLELVEGLELFNLSASPGMVDVWAASRSVIGLGGMNNDQYYSVVYCQHIFQAPTHEPKS